MIKHADLDEQCLLVDVLLHAGRMGTGIYVVVDEKSWFDVLYDQPGYAGEAGGKVSKDGGSGDEDDDEGTGNKR